jgi:hypothetical protein
VSPRSYCVCPFPFPMVASLAAGGVSGPSLLSGDTVVLEELKGGMLWTASLVRPGNCYASCRAHDWTVWM